MPAQLRIRGLGDLSPFITIHYDQRYDLYTVPSLAKKVRTVPTAYVLYDGRRVKIFSNCPVNNWHTKVCLGTFYDLMSEDERRLFDDNLFKILDIFENK